MKQQTMKSSHLWKSRTGKAHTGALFAAILMLNLSCLPGLAAAAPGNPDDRHYNDVGFFDIHVCNWPGRPLFFMPLFSTPRFADIDEIEVSYPDGRRLASLDLSRFRIITNDKQKVEKHAFINQLDVPTGAPEGWYTARIRLKNGEVHEAGDYVVLSRLPRATGQVPADGQEVPAPPGKLAWEPVDGAGFYQVFMRDQWNDDKLIFTSKLLDKPELVLPKGLLEPGGLYTWTIHARDVNEDIRLGDFNHGSMSRPVSFSVGDE
ncbi:MAG: hypothetical protein PVF08_08185 [Gammaproteobacteria bacterium]|jgi:hypothetical protein